jgi:anti-sigma B factor antagonist
MRMRTRHGTTSPLVIPEIVMLPAEIDLGNAGSTGHQLRAAFGPGTAVVIADMSATTFADSSAVRMLLEVTDAATAGQGELRIVIPGPRVLRVLQILGVDGMLAIFPTLDAALSARPGGPATA